MRFPAHLRIAVMPILDLFFVNKSSNGSYTIIGGQEQKLIELLSKKLSFTYTTLVPEDMAWGRALGNGTFTGIVGMVAREEADFAVANIAIVEERSFYVDFSHPYWYEKLIFAAKIPGYLPKTTSFVRPFTWELWLSVFLSMVAMSVAFHLLLKTKYSLTKKLVYVFGSLLGKANALKAISIPDRLLLGFWLIATLIISSSYSALFLSFLTRPLREPAVRTVHELSDALERGFFECRVIRGTAFVNIIQRSPVESAVNVGHFIERNEWYLNHRKDMDKYLTQHSKALIAPASDFNLLAVDDLVFSKDEFLFLMFAVAVRKTFCCKAALDLVLRRLSETGIYAKWKLDYSFRKLLPSRLLPTTDEYAVEPLTLSDLYGVFLILFAGYALSTLCVVFELIICSLKNRR